MAALERKARNDCTGFSSLRILVLGDAAVGKTALVENICSGSNRGAELQDGSAKNEWTCGCAVSVTRDVVEMGMRQLEVEIELWEVGGTQTYAIARPVFYDSFDAVVMVYDVSNMKSYQNLVVWLLELCTCSSPPSQRYWDSTGGSIGSAEADLEDGATSNQNNLIRHALVNQLCPILFVAHKCDLRPPSSNRHRILGESPRLPPIERPKKLPLLDRFLGGGENGSVVNRELTPADNVLVDQLVNVVQKGRHTEATSKEDAQSFDYACWRDFLRHAVEARQNR